MFDPKKKQVEQQLLKPIRQYAINFEYEFSNDETKMMKNKFNSNEKHCEERVCCNTYRLTTLQCWYTLINLPQLVST